MRIRDRRPRAGRASKIVLTATLGAGLLLALPLLTACSEPAAPPATTPYPGTPASEGEAGARSEPQASEVHQAALASATTPYAGTPASEGEAEARSEPKASEVNKAASASATSSDRADALFAPVSFQPPAAAAGPVVHEGVLDPGDSLAAVLGRQGVSPAVVGRIASGMWGTFDFRLARPGHSYRVTLRADGELDSFVYTVSPVESYRMVRQGDEFHASRIDTELVRRRARLAGIVTTSIYDAVADLGEEAQLASDFAAIFAWDLDFSRSVQRGDEFRLLYERTYASDGRGGEIYMGPGRILAASYRGGVGDLTAVYYETEPGRGGYYRPDGTSVQRRFLAAPLNYSRISSRYSNGRFHPILKVRRPHHGIDYAAPTGTPLWSVAHGTVIHKGWSRGFGRLVKIRHRNGYVSYYAHLSRYARGLQVGEAVQQKQVIGYVGQSGLATGPHVCFRMQKDGRYVNPASIQAPAGDPIPAQQLVGFETVRDELLARMGPASLVVTDEAL